FWGVIASMWIGNLMLVILNLPMVGIWVRLLRVPYRLLYPAIIVFCCIGAYTINSKPFDVYVMAFFAVFGYVALKLDCEPAPLVLGFVLGPMMEENLRRALLISRGDPLVFLQEPISLAFLLAAVGLLIVLAAPTIRGRRGEALREWRWGGTTAPNLAGLDPGYRRANKPVIQFQITRAINAKPEIGFAAGVGAGGGTMEGEGAADGGGAAI